MILIMVWNTILTLSITGVEIFSPVMDERINLAALTTLS